jgi:hypothetical protein
VNQKAKPFIPSRDQEALTPEEKIARAQEAQRLLEHPLLREAFANLKLDYFEAFTQCDPANVHGRDNIFHSARVLESVQQHLRVIMQDGKVTQAQMDKVAARSAGRAT